MCQDVTMLRVQRYKTENKEIKMKFNEIIENQLNYNYKIIVEKIDTLDLSPKPVTII